MAVLYDGDICKNRISLAAMASDISRLYTENSNASLGKDRCLAKIKLLMAALTKDNPGDFQAIHSYYQGFHFRRSVYVLASCTSSPALDYGRWMRSRCIHRTLAVEIQSAWLMNACEQTQCHPAMPSILLWICLTAISACWRFTNIWRFWGTLVCF